MEHCITKIGTEVDFCQVASFSAGKTFLWAFRRIFWAQNMWLVRIFQAHQDILSCSRSGLNACFSPAEVHKDQTPSPMLMCSCSKCKCKSERQSKLTISRWRQSWQCRRLNFELQQKRYILSSTSPKTALILYLKMRTIMQRLTRVGNDRTFVQ